MQKGFLSNSSQKVKIYRRKINTKSSNYLEISHRLSLLLKGFNDGYILADNIFLEKSQGNSENSSIYELFIIEPDFSSFSDKYLPLSEFLKKNRDFKIKKKIFENLLIIMKKIHQENMGYLLMNPRNIWIEDEKYVYLRPFLVDFEEINEKINDSCLNNTYSSFYKSPEETFISDYIGKNSRKNQNFLIECDLWALGCVFLDIFKENEGKPLFWTKNAEEKLFVFFEILEFPEKKAIPFLDENYYQEIKKIIERKLKKSDVLSEIMKDFEREQREIVKNLLVFDPEKRANLESLLKLDFFQKKIKVSRYSSDEKISKKLFSEEKSSKDFIKEKPKKFPNEELRNFSNGASENFSNEKLKNFIKEKSRIFPNENSENSKIFPKENLADFCEKSENLIKEKSKKISKERSKDLLKERLKKFSKENESFDDENELSISKEFKNEEIHEKTSNSSENYSENNNSLITNEEEWSNFEAIVTPKYEIFEKIHKKSKENNSKSVFLIGKEPSTELNTTNFTNFPKKKESVRFEMRLTRVFVFQSMKNAEISVQLMRKTKNGTLIAQDSINYVKIAIFLNFS